MGGACRSSLTAVQGKGTSSDNLIVVFHNVAVVVKAHGTMWVFPPNYTGGVTQVLVHVSTYQGSILVLPYKSDRSPLNPGTLLYMNRLSNVAVVKTNGFPF